MTTAEKTQKYIEILINKSASISTATDEKVQAIIDIIETAGILSDDEIITLTDDDDTSGGNTDEETETVKNGIVAENGSLYYYVDGVITYVGLIQIDGDYYYVRSSGEVVNNCTYTITWTHGLMDAGTYTFDENGKMIIETSDTGGTETEVTYTVSYSLDNVTADNTATEVSSGESYTATLTANDGYEIDTVSITMGGEDITADVYSDGTVTIPTVSGDITITATAAEKAVEYTVTYNLTNCSNQSTEPITTVAEGESFDGTFVYDDGYVPMYITITMGGVDITNEIYSNNTGETECNISIPTVTGNVEITITAVTNAYTVEYGELSIDLTSNRALAVYCNDSYTTTLTADDGYCIMANATVTMGGEEITADVLSFNDDCTVATITIDSVTGNIVIMATQTEI